MDDQKQSGLGVASFVTGITSAFLTLLAVGSAGVAEATTPGGLDANSDRALAIGVVLFSLTGVAGVALGLGIGGLVQKHRKKQLAVIGTVISAGTLGGVLLLVMLGGSASDDAQPTTRRGRSSTQQRLLVTSVSLTHFVNKPIEVRDAALQAERADYTRAS